MSPGELSGGPAGPDAGSQATGPTSIQIPGDTSGSGPLKAGESLEGNPEELGVASVDFVTAMFPTSPEEYRVAAAWLAGRYNVENAWVEKCMSESGFVLDVPAETARTFRRSSELPDFELDARFGIIESLSELPEPPGPPASSSPAEAAAWQERYLECSLEVEERRSQEFDQVLGRVPFWMGIVREVNESPEMLAATETLLTCVSANGGPKADSITDLYLEIDSLALQADSREERDSLSFEVANLIADCAGDYNETRQALLIPKRDEILNQYQEEIARAERYFNEVLLVLEQD